MLREYIIGRVNVGKVEKDSLIKCVGNKYFVSAEYIGEDVTDLVMKNYS